MTMRRLIEEDVNLIIEEIKSKITGVLANVRSVRTDHKVNVDPPRSYFIYPNASGYKTPAIFVIGDNMSFRQAEKGANHIAALSRVNVTCLVEEKTSELCTIKCFRYLSALHEILDMTNLVSADSKVKIIVRVSDADNSAIYTNTDNKADMKAVFRKEVYLTCDVEHFENF